MNNRIKLTIAGIVILVAISGFFHSQIQVNPPTAPLTIISLTSFRSQARINSKVGRNTAGSCGDSRKEES
jgi:hypothetical protein